MKFDVIIGNPPYQLNTGGAQAQAIPIYNKFVLQAKKLRPRYLTMIIPSRWFTGGFGLDSFREEMLHDKSLRIIHDFLNATECFPGVEIKGGVCYFLWDRDNKGDVTITTHEGNGIVSSMTRPLLEEGSDVFIRYNGAIPILNKVLSRKEKSFSTIVSSQRPFGLPTNFSDYTKTGDDSMLKIYGNKFTGYLNKDIVIDKNDKYIGKWKLFTPKAVGTGDSKTDVLKPIIAGPNAICTETYVAIGPFETKEEAENAYSYTQTKFFHFLLTMKKNTQDCLARAFCFIPIQDFSKKWTDKELYAKYNFTAEEIEYVKNLVNKNVGN